MEVYAIAVVVFLLAVGGIGGAVVISGNESSSSNPSSNETAVAVGQNSGSPVAEMPSNVVVEGSIVPDIANTSKATTAGPQTSSSVRDEALERMISEQLARELAAKKLADYLVWAKQNPITRVDGVDTLAQACDLPDGINRLQIRFRFTNFGTSHWLGAASPATSESPQDIVDLPLFEYPAGSHSVVLDIEILSSVRNNLVLWGTFNSTSQPSESAPSPDARNVNVRVPLGLNC